MRLWSLHPRLLDRRALVALWREGLLAQAVLRGQTRGYRHHPQLNRFHDSSAPVAAIVAYLQAVHVEATRRGYSFDARKLARARVRSAPLEVSRDQLGFEWRHLRAKVRRRDAEWWRGMQHASLLAHPLFRVVDGPVATWERGVTAIARA